MSRRRVAVLFLALLGGAASSCSSSGGIEADGSTQAAAQVIVEGGAEVTGLRYTPESGAAQATSTAGVPAIDRKSPFPLLAYRELCDVPREELGLDRPRLQVALSGGGSVPEEIVFGATNFNGAGVYTATGAGGCAYLVTASSVSQIAALAGPEAAAAFRPPPGPDLEAGEAEEEQKEVVHPWVAQADRHSVRGSGGSPPLEEGGTDHAS